MSVVGTTYGKYFLLKKLASGGMGEVFLARQQGLAGFEKVVVVKRLLSHLTESSDHLELFLQEARLQARMNHASIVQIFDLGQAEDGSFFLAMELVHGKSLAEILTRLRGRRERIPPALAAQIVARAAGGLSYAHAMVDNAGHSLNIIHRDISPHNVLVSYQGDVKLIDFGIAKSEMSVVKTETGTIKGKFYYMSPEQSAASRLDKRSDIFSLGIVLYECLTGENPFVRGNVVLSLEAIQKVDPPPPSAADAALQALDPILARALAKRVEDRYPDASLLKDDLARAQLEPCPESLGAFVRRLFKDKYEQETKALLDTDASSIAQLRPSTPSPTRVALVRDADPPDFRGFDRATLSSGAARARDVAREGDGATGSAIEAGGPREAEPSEDERRDLMPRGAKIASGLALAATVLAVALFKARWPAAAPGPAPEVQGFAAQEADEAKAAEVRRWAAEQTLAAANRGAGASVVPRPQEGEEAKIAEATRTAGPDVTDAPRGLETITDSRRGLKEPRRLSEERKATAIVQALRTEPEARPARIANARVGSRPEAKTVGSLLVRATPTGEVRLNGRAVSGETIDLAGPSGMIDVAPQGSPLRIRLVYADSMLELQSEPWAIAYVNGLSLGKTPARLPVDEAMMHVELKRPGVDQTPQLMLRYRKP